MSAADKIVQSVCAMLCLTVFMGALGVASLIIAYNEGDDPCQERDVTGLTMADWLKGFGFCDVAALGCLWIIFGLLATGMADTECFEGLGSLLGLLWLLFKLVWWIIGLVVFFRSSLDCVGHGRNVGIMAIIDFVLFI